MGEGFWYIDCFDTVGPGGVTGFVIKHTNETDWLFFPCKTGMVNPELLDEIMERLNASEADDRPRRWRAE